MSSAKCRLNVLIKVMTKCGVVDKQLEPMMTTFYYVESTYKQNEWLFPTVL